MKKLFLTMAVAFSTLIASAQFMAVTTYNAPEDGAEWEAAGEWMWQNRECYNGLSVLPYDGGTYTQAPFEDITEEEFNKRVKSLHEVNLLNIMEDTDDTDLSGELACAGGGCEITSL